MQCFAMPYLVMFHDTMAYGSHHFMTNFKFQCVIREHLLFDNSLNVTTSNGKNEFDKLVLLTQQGYCRNLAPVRVGEKIAIFLTVEEPTLSTVRFCFRVIRYDGAPVTCGFQTIVCVSSDTGMIVPAPQFVLQHGTRMMEPLTSPSFAERVLAGRTKDVFNESVISLGIKITNSEPHKSYPRFVSTEDHFDAVASSSPAVSPVTQKLPNGVVFLFPGQGSYAPNALRQFYHCDLESRVFLHKADVVTERLLGVPILKLITAEKEQHDDLLKQSPDLAQIGIYLGSVLTARYLSKNGLKPDCVAGHSAGELAALATAGVYTPEQGVEIMCKRVLGLQSANTEPGGMLAVFCAEDRVRTAVEQMGNSSLRVAIVNHTEQTVVSGLLDDLLTFAQRLEELGIRSTRLKSGYPFHSSLLERAVPLFEDSLKNIRFAPPVIPVYSPIEQDFYAAQSDMAALLASHFVRPFKFSDALHTLSSLGGRIFIECGGGNVLGKLVRRVVPTGEELRIYSPLAKGTDTIYELKAVVQACGKGESASGPLKKQQADSPSADRSSGRPDAEKGECIPVAIVSMGCVLPGAGTPLEFWQNILSGRSGLSDAAELSPDMAKDFLSRGEVVPDKTYTLLGGFVRDFSPDIQSLPYSEPEFSRLSLAQRFLSEAMHQCIANPAHSIPGPDKVHCYIGSTGDGVIEYDESLLLAGLHHEVDKGSIGQKNERQLFHQLLDQALGANRENAHRFAPHASYTDVAERFIGKGVKVTCVDAACASSLYAIDLGISALRRGECDAAFCGGVFAPGPANSCLFSQFRGLSATGSRPLDASADGVVFGEGAAILMLKRLPVAIAAGDKILAVIRGSGLSNDGKSPSVAVPRRQGQVIALRRAYEETVISPKSIQYVEAHATATPVGDTEEFGALTDIFSTCSSRGSIELGSVKALIGHTGWLAGAASVIKMTEALNARVIPPQHNFKLPNPNFRLPESPFRISFAPRPWPDNDGNEPRRAGVNGFGFGGSNAHVIMEEYVPSYHEKRWGKTPAREILPDRVLSVVGVGALFPFDAVIGGNGGNVLHLDRSVLKLPKGFMILPDVAEHMDKAQLLAFLAAFESLKGLGDAWKSWKSSIGVVLGVEGKSGLGITINKRIYIDSIERKLNDLAPSFGLTQSDFAAIKNEMLASLRRIQPSGPYTLPGLMPNVTSGRVGNLLDLNGPNFVIDSGRLSLYEALSTAETLLSSGKALMVLAGGVNGYAGAEIQTDPSSLRGAGDDKRPTAEGAMVLAVTRPDFAAAHDLPVLAKVGMIEEGTPGKNTRAGEATPFHLNGAEGAPEVVKAIEQAASGQKQNDVVWTSPDGRPRILRIFAGNEDRETKQTRIEKRITATEKIDPASPIYFCTPCLIPRDAPQGVEPHRIRKGGVVVLADQAFWLERSEAKAVLDELKATILCPAARPIPNAIPIDLSSDESIAGCLRVIDFGNCDAIIAVKDLAETAPFDGVIADGGAGGGLLDLMFAVVRHCNEKLKAGATTFASLCLNSPQTDHLHPYSGLFSGFVKAIAREFSGTACKALVTDAPDLRVALDQIEAEWGSGPLPAAAEVIYKRSRRHEYTLRRLPVLSSGDEPTLKPDSVVIATGGGRGVTAVLVEELLRASNCSVLLLGRTSLSDIPHHILLMSQQAFDAHETEFYRDEMKRSPGVRMNDLKKRYEHYRNAREIQQTLTGLSEMAENVEYLPVDITDPQALDHVIQSIAEKYGKVDLVIHGAGIQVSKSTARKKVEEFRSIIATKIGGLGNLYQSVRRHFPESKTHFHLITSVFSYFGNDGQPDYGAANEAMNHIAEWMGSSGTEGEWTTLGWLGWAGIGMTRGSEWVALQQWRQLRAVTQEEGQAIFSDLLYGKPIARANLMISDGEIDFFKVSLLDSASALPRIASAVKERPAAADRASGGFSWDLSLHSHPYVMDHIVGGRPTFPGSFEAELAVQTARAIRPDLKAVMLENTNLVKFIRVPPSGNITVRGKSEELGEAGGNVLVKVQLLTDFVHSSGKILKKDIVHFETTVHMSANANPIISLGTETEIINGALVPDPYLSPDAFVRLKGFFDCLDDIEIGIRMRKGKFRIKHANMISALSDFQLPAILLDALFRFSMIHQTSDGMIPLYVPIKGREVHIAPGINDVILAGQADEIYLQGTNPKMEGEMSHNDWVQACDRTGRVLLMAKDFSALMSGKVPVTDQAGAGATG